MREVKFRIIVIHQMRLFGSGPCKNITSWWEGSPRHSRIWWKRGDRQSEYYQREKKNQLDEQLILRILRQTPHVSGVSRSIIRSTSVCILRQPLHVSGVSRPIIRRYIRMYTTSTSTCFGRVKAHHQEVHPYVYYVNIYMFRACQGPSSRGTSIRIQQLGVIILFRWLSVVLVGLEQSCKEKPTSCTTYS